MKVGQRDNAYGKIKKFFEERKFTIMSIIDKDGEQSMGK